MGLSKHKEMVMDKELWHAVLCGVTKSLLWLSDWTAKINKQKMYRTSMLKNKNLLKKNQRGSKWYGDAYHVHGLEHLTL